MLLYWRVVIDRHFENTKQWEENKHAVVGEK